MHSPTLHPDDARRIARRIMCAIDELDGVDMAIGLPGYEQLRSELVNLAIDLTELAGRPFNQDFKFA